MLHNRQAPGRDFHKHFSLAPARSDTNPPSHPQSAPAPTSPTRQGSSSQCDVESNPPATHPSHSPRPTPLAPSHPRPTPSLLPSLHLHQAPSGATHKGARGAQASVVVGAKGHPSSHPQRHPPPPSGPAQSYVLSDCRTPEPVSVPGALPCMARSRRR